MSKTKIRIDNLNVRLHGGAPDATREALQGLGPELAARLSGPNQHAEVRGDKPHELRNAVAARVAAALVERLKR